MELLRCLWLHKKATKTLLSCWLTRALVRRMCVCHVGHDWDQRVTEYGGHIMQTILWACLAVEVFVHVHCCECACGCQHDSIAIDCGECGDVIVCWMCALCFVAEFEGWVPVVCEWYCVVVGENRCWSVCGAALWLVCLHVCVCWMWLLCGCGLREWLWIML